MASFADIKVSQGSVATYARCGGIFNMHLTANLPRNLSVKKNYKSVKIWQNYGHKSVAPFLAHPVDNNSLSPADRNGFVFESWWKRTCYVG